MEPAAARVVPQRLQLLVERVLSTSIPKVKLRLDCWFNPLVAVEVMVEVQSLEVWESAYQQVLPSVVVVVLEILVGPFP